MEKNNSQGIILIILVLALLGLGGYIIYDKTTSQSTTQANYETKIKELEQEIEVYKKEEQTTNNSVSGNSSQSSTSELDQLNSMLTGTYSYGKVISGDDCTGLPEDEVDFVTITFNTDGTSDFNVGVNCGSAGSGSGKYYFNKNEVVVVDEECIREQPANCRTTYVLKYKNGNLYHTGHNQKDYKLNKVE